MDPPNYIIEKQNRVKRVGDWIGDQILPHFKKQGERSGIHLEIGSGHGHWLTSFALHYPHRIFVGIDLLSKRIKKSERKKEIHNLKNLFFIKAEASEFLEALPEQLNVLSTYIMFPDPWPKKRHFKNRLIQEDFLNQLAHVSSKNSKIHFRTDHNGYYEWALDTLGTNQFWQINQDPWPHEATSFFQDFFEKTYTCSATRG